MRGGLPTIGMVSLGPARRRFKVEVLGTEPLEWSKPRESLSWDEVCRLVLLTLSWDESGLTTTIAGARLGISAVVFLWSSWEGVDTDLDKFEDDWGGGTWLAELRWLADWDVGFAEFGGGGGGVVDWVAVLYLESFFEELESWELFLLSYWEREMRERIGILWNQGTYKRLFDSLHGSCSRVTSVWHPLSLPCHHGWYVQSIHPLFNHPSSPFKAIYAVYTSPSHPPIPNHLPTLIVTPHGTHFLLSQPNCSPSRDRSTLKHPVLVSPHKLCKYFNPLFLFFYSLQE